MSWAGLLARFQRAFALVCVTAASVSASAQTNSLTIPAWAFDRGNVRVFTEEYADAGPMVAYGGRSPVFVEYDIEFPAAGSYTLSILYAGGSPRPVELQVDGQAQGPVCRDATGSWNTSGAKWEQSRQLELTAGKHTLGLRRSNDFPHVVSLRFESSAIPDGFVVSRPKARKLPKPGAAPSGKPFENAVSVAAVRLAIEDLTASFGSRYAQGQEFLSRLSALESALREPVTASQARSNLVVLQREALLANPLLDFDNLLLLKRGFPNPPAARRAMGQALGVGSLNAHTSDDTPRQGHWNDELAVLSHLRGEPKFTTLYRPETNETLIEPALHFDADRLLFAKNGEREKNWRLFELSLGNDPTRPLTPALSPEGGEGVPPADESNSAVRKAATTVVSPSPLNRERAGVRGEAVSGPRSDERSHAKQLTPDDGADVAHFDPCYLPDGRIIFASTAVYQGLPCEFGAQAMTCLYLFDPKKGIIRQLTFEQDSDWCPTMLPNGRVLYQRWEYTDQSHANSRILFHMNPDGTDQREFRGSGSWFPGSFFYARAIPGEEHQVIGIATGHHGTPRSGRLLIFDPSQGRRDGEGIVQEIPFRGKKVEPIVRDRLVDGVWPQFLMPWPLSAKYHLVAAKLRPDALWGIYLADVFDNLTLITEVEGTALLWPIPLQKTPKPPVIPDRVNLATDEATVFITDIYAGPGLQGVPRGKVKKLRVLEYYFSRRGFGGLYGTLGADGPWDVKRILGTAPVEADGSAHFKIPANSPLSLQPLDEKGQALQLMRSWFVGMPGEAMSCSGCHEPQNEVSFNKPALAARRRANELEPWHGPARGFGFVREVQPVLDRYCVSCHDGRAGVAAAPHEFRPEEAIRPASPLTPALSPLRGEGTRGEFLDAGKRIAATVRNPQSQDPETRPQAVASHSSDAPASSPSPLDGERAGVRGENGEEPPTRAKSPVFSTAPDLRGGILLTNWSTQLAGHWSGGGKFTTAYWELQRFVRRPGIEGDRRMFTPMDYHFSTTELGQLLDKGHHGVTLDAESWERLALWADFNAPFYGTWGEIPQFCTETNGAARLARVNTRAMELRRKYVPMGPHPDYEVIPKIPKYDTTPVKPHPPAESSKPKAQSSISGWPFNAEAAAAKQKAAAPNGAITRTLALGDSVTLELTRIPGGRFVMGSTNGHADEAPLTVVEVSPFWMARLETSNRQFRQFKPEHESRTEDRHGYQFGVLAYDQDQPEQPAVRVSWREAMAFCQWLSQKTGLKVTLPTEAQWEWACRAGRETPFWFGHLDADYSSFANLGDQRLAEFAADTSLDHYSAARPMVNPNRFDDWLPRDDRFNDGGFVTEPVGQYQPNPWGLHDMHGNAWEWTRTVFRTYPYRDEDGRNDFSAGKPRVVRGGSWRDRPQRATASFRLAYAEYQRVFNVGFRVVCEGSAEVAMRSLTQP